MDCEINKNVYDHRVLSEWSKVNDNQKNLSNNVSCVDELPIDMIFNDGHRLSMTVYR